MVEKESGGKELFFVSICSEVGVVGLAMGVMVYSGYRFFFLGVLFCFVMGIWYKKKAC